MKNFGLKLIQTFFDYCAYLGSIETSYSKFDLGLWKNISGNMFSLVWVEGNGFCESQSVSFITNDVKTGEYISEYVLSQEIGKELPIKEAAILALKHEWLRNSRFSFMDLEKKFYTNEVLNYIATSKKSHKVNACLKYGIEVVELDLIVSEETHWKNKFELDGNEFDYDLVQLIEVDKQNV